MGIDYLFYIMLAARPALPVGRQFCFFKCISHISINYMSNITCNRNSHHLNEQKMRVCYPLDV